MIVFSAEIHAFPDYSEDAKLIEERAVVLEAFKVPQVVGAPLWPKYPLATSLDIYFQVGLRRILEQIEALVRDMNARAFAPVWVGARALLETVAVLFDLRYRVRMCVSAPTNDVFKELDDHLFRLSLGFKSEDWTYSKDVVAKNILTIVERTDKRASRAALEDVGGREPDFMKCFDLLCEGAHPNYIGTLESYQKPDLSMGNSRLIDRPALTDPRCVVIPLGMTATALAMALTSLETFHVDREEFARLLPTYSPPVQPQPTLNPQP